MNDIFDIDGNSVISNNNKKENYIYINTNNFDINKVIFLSDDNVENRYNIRYINDNTNIYIVPEKAFSSYGVKDRYNGKYKLKNRNNDSDSYKISIKLDINNIYHQKFKNVIDEIYNRLDINFKKKNIKVHYPISDKYSTINLDINETTPLYIYKNQVMDLIDLDQLIRYNHIPFKIWPHIYIKNFNLNKNIIYFNFVIKVAVIEFSNLYGSYDDVIYAFSEDPRDNDSTESSQSNMSKIKKLNKIKERF